MDNKNRFLLGQKVWCVLDLSDGVFGEGIIDSEWQMSEYGLAFYKISLNDNTYVNVFVHNIFETKQELLNYVNDLIHTYDVLNRPIKSLKKGDEKHEEYVCNFKYN